MATEQQWIALARLEIPKMLEDQHAVVKPELIARLSELYFPNEKGNLDQHVIGQALNQLVRAGTVSRKALLTRGGRRPIETFSFANEEGRGTAIAAAAGRKRLLYGRYLGWAEGTERHPQGVIGSAGERAVREAVLAAGTLTPGTVGAGEVKNILNTELPGPADSGGHIIGREPNGDPGEIVTVLIEVKNIREWVYPRHEKLYQVLYKGALLQRARPDRNVLPVLVCRAAAKTTFYMARRLGFFVIAMRSQYLIPTDADGIDEVRNELHFVDLKPLAGPDPVVQARFRDSLPQHAVTMAGTWHTTSHDDRIYAALTDLASTAVTGANRDQRLNDLRNAVRSLAGDGPRTPLGW